MGHLSEQLIKFLDSEEGKLAIEKEKKHWEHLNEITDKWMGKFHNLAEAKKIELLRKLKTKYESEEYLSRFKNRLENPHYPLYGLLETYAVTYGRQVILSNLENEFVTKFHICDNFVLKIFDGLYQTSYQLEEYVDRIIPHKFYDTTYSVYRYGEQVFTTTSKLSFDDALAQIKEKHLEGYTVIIDENEYIIKKDGRLIFSKIVDNGELQF